ncbi:protein-L-isoaspartate(D-aspartate) O-methyltransferase [Ancylomarina longa]|uniref:Protein-L-isoaspartate O-methyltransferase n=1 Tax=Ancylomarina longa TaxID=2487017 RepID=A0A434AF71_9BACT|nr:protein-L-isoaspartate(D-aspartate) O-methyltransferase [Ancylomarina longa]RUT73019.1 protein-L-isoaspartate(D-aspartate) O-methyltransferase [Ancylomarina longa]
MKLSFVFGLLFVMIGVNTGKEGSQQMDYKAQRKKMLADQIIGRGITDTDVINAMDKVERHLFVPSHFRMYAYNDRPLPIGQGQTISQPYIVGLMVQLLGGEPDDRILEIGTGSGYEAAILAEIYSEVYTIEIVAALKKRATFVLDSLAYKNVHVRLGDGYLGWPEEAPFDGIIVSCSPVDIPPPLIDQLAEGGKLIIPVGKTNVKQLVVIKKKKGKLSKRSVIPVRFVPMVDEKGNAY